MIVNRNIFTKLQLNKEIKPWWAEIQKHLYQLQTFERQCLYIHDYFSTFIYCYIFVFIIYVNGKTKMMYNTIVVSWMDPKLLIKMFTRSSTGIPKNKTQTHCTSQHINHIHQTRRTKGHSSNLHSTLSHGLLRVTLTFWFMPWNICFHFMYTMWKA